MTRRFRCRATSLFRRTFQTRLKLRRSVGRLRCKQLIMPNSSRFSRQSASPLASFIEVVAILLSVPLVRGAGRGARLEPACGYARFAEQSGGLKSRPLPGAEGFVGFLSAHIAFILQFLGAGQKFGTDDIASGKPGTLHIDLPTASRNARLEFSIRCHLSATCSALGSPLAIASP